MLAGRTPLQALLEQLANTNIVHYFEQDKENRLTHLFILSSSAKEICRLYSRGKIWLLDSTYKTNRYGIPLLHLVCVTATNHTFTLCYCFLRRETLDDYRWALQKLLELFEGLGISQPTFVTDRVLWSFKALLGGLTVSITYDLK